MLEAAGFRVHWCESAPAPEGPGWSPMPYLGLLGAEIADVKPDVLLCASSGGIYVLPLWQAGPPCAAERVAQEGERVGRSTSPDRWRLHSQVLPSGTPRAVRRRAHRPPHTCLRINIRPRRTATSLGCYSPHRPPCDGRPTPPRRHLWVAPPTLGPPPPAHTPAAQHPPTPATCGSSQNAAPHPVRAEQMSKACGIFSESHCPTSLRMIAGAAFQPKPKTTGRDEVIDLQVLAMCAMCVARGGIWRYRSRSCVALCGALAVSELGDIAPPPVEAGLWDGPTVFINAHPHLNCLPVGLPVVIAHGSNDKAARGAMAAQ